MAGGKTEYGLIVNIKKYPALPDTFLYLYKMPDLHVDICLFLLIYNKNL